ncbi:hypothetical protein QMA80_06245 [Burkholderia pseudomallei]|uniref:hypothetical protein n=1 Tax=Burkholderia pseudomallei TaxID=28450 RepID=UPI002DB9EAC6|nr:hypothetical protein [Burkholderia pseudomallei]MEB5496542.1 hypothetical protein [Burkholderia pseudomallei]
MAIKEEGCVEITSASKIKVSEKRAKAIILNPNKEKYLVVHFDGCVIKNATAADYLISKIEVGDLIVELKGRNVKHAVEQIIATVDYLRRERVSEGCVGALVVCNEYPKTNTIVQALKLDLKKRFDCPLKVSTENPEVEFLSLLGKRDLVEKRGGRKRA